MPLLLKCLSHTCPTMFRLGKQSNIPETFQPRVILVHQSEWRMGISSLWQAVYLQVQAFLAITDTRVIAVPLQEAPTSARYVESLGLVSIQEWLIRGSSSQANYRRVSHMLRSKYKMGGNRTVLASSRTWLRNKVRRVL